MDPHDAQKSLSVPAEVQSAWKKLAAEFAAARVPNGCTLGLGTGSTAELAVVALAQRMREEGLRFTGVATSERIQRLAASLGIPLAELDAVSSIDMSIDGADEVTLPGLDLVKGRGGALLREKMIAAASRHRVIIVDATKVKPALGAGPIPVEVAPFGWRHTAERLAHLNARPMLRPATPSAAGATTTPPFVTDGGNYVLDCYFGLIADPAALSAAIKGVTGVVDHGLFIGMTERVHVANADGVRTFDRSL